MWWKCKKCEYEWQDTPKHRYSGRGCPNCARKGRIITRIEKMTTNGRSLFNWCEKNGDWGNQLLSEWSEKNDFSPEKITFGSSRKVWWKCTSAHEWKATVNNRVRGAKCPYCTNKRTLSGYNDLESLFPELMTEWIYEENEKEPSKIRPGSNFKAWWKCQRCGNAWQAAVYNRTYNHSGCPFCSGSRIILGKSDFQTLFPDLMSEWDFENNSDIKPSEFSPGSDQKAWWICSKCGYRWYTEKIGSRATSARSLSHTFPGVQPNPAGHEPHLYKTCRGWKVSPLPSAGSQSRLYLTALNRRAYRKLPHKPR